MLEVDLYNLIFLVELIVILGLVYQELGIKPLIIDMKSRLKEILKDRNIKTIEKPSDDSLNVSYKNLQNKYNHLSVLLMEKEDIGCSSQPIWSDEESFTCKIFKNLISNNLAYAIITYIMLLSILFYLMLLILSPIMSVKIFIAGFVSKDVVYYIILAYFILCLVFILFCIYNFKEIKEKLFGDNGKIEKLELEYFQEYDTYIALEKKLIKDVSTQATQATQATQDI